VRRVGLGLINSDVDHWRQFVALLQCLPPAERTPRRKRSNLARLATA
jgi:hypothetical protein